MGQDRYARAFLSIAWCLFVCCLVKYHPSLLARGFSKLLIFLVFGSLLMFVVVHSAEIRRVAVVLLEPLRLPLFSLVVDPGWIERPPTPIPAPEKATLPPLFQRPPPVSSL